MTPAGDPSPPPTPEDEPVEDDGPDPLRFHRWMRASPTGAVLTGVAMGLHEALVEHEQRPAYVVEAPGEPADDSLVELRLDPDDPAKTVAVVRPQARPAPAEGGEPAPGRERGGDRPAT